MNGIHDMGGMQDMGPLRYEKDEPVFHEPWEGRVYVIRRAMGAWRKWTTDHARHEVERIPPADYLRMSYYERWLVSTEELIVKSGLITRAELESGKPAPGSVKATPPLKTADMQTVLVRPKVARPDAQVKAKFKVGEHVRARNINPAGHIRLPRYARGKAGVIQLDHGIYVFPDTIVAGRGEKPQHVYSVRFEARELWGPEASPRHAVYLDLWDDYLDHV
jgi:nitrile hydratase subunit beta